MPAPQPLTQINLGSNDVESLPHTTDSYQGIKALERDFSAGVNDPIRIVVDGDVQGAGVQDAIARLQQKVAQNPSFQWLGVQADQAGHTALIEVSSSAVDTGAASRQMVSDLRADTAAAFQGSGAKAYVTGNLPGFFDVKNQTDAAVSVVFAFVLGLSFLLLLVFRSVAIPAKAILMNLLSVGAAYGLIVAVFQKGFLAKQLGFQTTPRVEFWLPLFLFSILFGLSMDYHVFLLSRVKEEFDRTGDNRLAVRAGVQSTAGMITSAAIIMVAVFAAFSRSSQVSLQQMGFGLAIAVFIDATVIRSILVPSAMQLLGRYNWWMPSWLGWLPRISVEGGAALAADAGEPLGLAAADGAPRAPRRYHFTRRPFRDDAASNGRAAGGRTHRRRLPLSRGLPRAPPSLAAVGLRAIPGGAWRRGAWHHACCRACSKTSLPAWTPTRASRLPSRTTQPLPHSNHPTRRRTPEGRCGLSGVGVERRVAAQTH